MNGIYFFISFNIISLTLSDFAVLHLITQIMLIKTNGLERIRPVIYW